MTTFVGTILLLIVLPKPFGTFRNTLPEQHGTPGILKGGNQPSNFRWSIDFQGELHHRVGAAVWMESMGLFVALVNRVTGVILGERQAGNYPKSYPPPLPAGVGSFV